jgi:hypothetical protein
MHDLCRNCRQSLSILYLNTSDSDFILLKLVLIGSLNPLEMTFNKRTQIVVTIYFIGIQLDKPSLLRFNRS